MRTTAILFYLSVLVLCVVSVRPPAATVDEAPAVDLDLVDSINRAQLSWKAGVNERFSGMKVKDVKKLCGVKVASASETTALPLKEVAVPADIPATFDARTQWPACPSIGTILDQGHCGSCWAFGAIESLSDRFCIGSNGKTQVLLAAQDLTSCDDSSMGCDGGFPPGAWDYMKKTGVVTEPCYPYAMGTCQHPGCSEEPTPSCNKTCNNKVSFKGDKHHASSAYSIGSNVTQIQAEILANGPVEGTFTVYVDFNNYKSGVYYHVSGAEEGGHAIKIIGWGTENNVDYWLVANSWNTNWGDAGFFKIRRGTDECGIEDGIVAGLAKV